MLQPIAGYRIDADGWWVARLGCGHGHHLRHRPPFELRPWVLTHGGRQAAIGELLPCPWCDEADPPPPRPRPGFLDRRCFVFDLDGTLTEPLHDFDAMRAALGLPPRRPILESIAALPPDEAARTRARLADLEVELADRARPRAGAAAVLDALAARGARLGILTRNRKDLALRTLAAAGLEGRFDEARVLGRDDAVPKPDPDGVRRLLAAWRAGPDEAVFVGNGAFDVQAGRAAGTATVGIGAFEGPEPDLRIELLGDLL